MVDLPTRHVYATYLHPNGTPQYGYVEFRLTTEVNIPNEVLIPIATVQANLDLTGRIDADLIISDGVNVYPQGLTWLVEEKIENGNTWYLRVPQGDGSPVDLTTLYVPGLVPPGYAISGVPGPEGPQGPQGPSGAYYGPSEPPTTDVIWIDSDDTESPLLDAALIGSGSAAANTVLTANGAGGASWSPSVGNSSNTGFASLFMLMGG